VVLSRAEYRLITSLSMEVLVASKTGVVPEIHSGVLRSLGAPRLRLVVLVVVMGEIRGE
jgi:hypothetical protein